jgi:UDP-glucuronate decarboxylase
LACPASPVHYQVDPVGTVKTNVLGAINALELARKNKCGVLQASTSEVYGDPLISPQSESYLGNVNPIGIRACYDEGKRVAETLFFDYHRQFAVDIKVVRIFNTYGPGMKFDDGRVVSNFITQALSNEPLTVYGDGKQTRSFCYVSDLVEGLIKMSNSDFHGPVNLGNPNEFTIHELALMVQDLIGSEVNIVQSELPADDPKIRRPDINLAKKELGWNPSIDLRSGLIETIKDFKSRILSGEN